MTHYIYDAEGLLIGTHEGGNPPANSTTLEPVYAPGHTPQFRNGAWVDQSVPPKVSPVEFKLLFSALERVAIKAARVSDPVIDDFFSIIEDPRLTHVDLGLQSTRDAIAYLVGNSLLTQARADQILAGTLQ